MHLIYPKYFDTRVHDKIEFIYLFIFFFYIIIITKKDNICHLLFASQGGPDSSKRRSTLKRMNLLLGEQIHSFKELTPIYPIWKGGRNENELFA